MISFVYPTNALKNNWENLLNRNMFKDCQRTESFDEKTGEESYKQVAEYLDFIKISSKLSHL